MKKVLTIAFFVCTTAFASKAQTKLPQILYGNWINKTSNNWDISFFEKFAIYDCDFWDYKTVTKTNGGYVVSIQNGKKKQDIKVTIKNDSALSIIFGQLKKADYVLMKKEYPHYTQPDFTPFPKPDFKQDSATLIGYYRNFDKIPMKYVEEYGSRIFEVLINDIIKTKQVNYVTSIDSVGRFKITFPVVNSQEILLDWDRLGVNFIVQPKDKMFLFADMNDLFDGENKDSSTGMQQVLVMGKNARLNNEMLQSEKLYHVFSYVNTLQFKDLGLTDLQMLDTCKNVYEKNKQILARYITQYPALSYRFKEIKTIQLEQKLAYNLMWCQVNLPGNNRLFSSAYMDYVKKNASPENELGFTMGDEILSFLVNRIAYEYWKNGSIVYQDYNLLEEAHKRGMLPDSIKQIKYSNVNSREDTTPVVMQQMDENMKSVLANVAEALDLEKHIAIADTVFENSLTKQLYASTQYYKLLDMTRLPLSDYSLTYFKNKVTIEYFTNRILKLNDYYYQLTKKDVDPLFRESIGNVVMPENVRGETDSLLNALFSPYRGKVICLDIWGTWCGPCRHEMQYAKTIEEQMKDKDVVFMYLANESPKATWEALIKEMEVYGKNVVHYNLPSNQQKLIEAKFGVNSYPSFFLIDKIGKVAVYKGPKPSKGDALLKEIEKLLKE